AYIPGHELAYLINPAAHIGIRESRRIRGDYRLTGDDVRGGAHFDDAIARGIYLLDIHNPAEIARPSALILLDQPYSIPYRCLLPVGIDGLLVAGRCISGDHIALASYRVQSHAMAIGQAAGTAAALSVHQRCSPRRLDIHLLRDSLRAAGANVGDAVDRPRPAT
ncbi:MAG: FAD-dependent oxidoreductase, partial [Planctomycetota bacterium]